MRALGDQRERRPRRRWAVLSRHLLVCALALAGDLPTTLGADVQVLIASEDSYYMQAVASLREHLAALHPGVVTEVDTDLKADWKAEDLLVTVGSDAMVRLRAEHPQRVALHLFITSDSWLQQRAGDPGLAENPALVFDQPPRHLVALTRALLPRATTLAIVLGPISGKHLNQVHGEAEKAGFEPLVGALSADANPLATLSPLVEATDAALVLPDSADFNSAVARWLLQLSFRARTPVIAFSRAYANAGALASVFVTPEDIGREAAGILDRWLKTGEYPRGMQYPDAYSIATNPAVATALDIELPDDEALRARFEAVLEALP